MNTPRTVPGAAVLLVCAAAALLASATAIAPAQAASTDTAGLAYVALGDSYAAGYGIQPPTDQPVPGCDQSAQDYPHRLAAADIPAGTPWINGLSISSLTPPSLQPGALHPDAAGVAYLTAQLTAAIRSTLPPNSVSTNPTAYHRLVPSLALAIIVASAAAILLLRRRTRRRAARHSAHLGG